MARNVLYALSLMAFCAAFYGGIVSAVCGWNTMGLGVDSSCNPSVYDVMPDPCSAGDSFYGCEGGIATQGTCECSY